MNQTSPRFVVIEASIAVISSCFPSCITYPRFGEVSCECAHDVIAAHPFEWCAARSSTYNIRATANRDLCLVEAPRSVLEVHKTVKAAAAPVQRCSTGRYSGVEIYR